MIVAISIFPVLSVFALYFDAVVGKEKPQGSFGWSSNQVDMRQISKRK